MDPEIKNIFLMSLVVTNRCADHGAAPDGSVGVAFTSESVSVGEGAADEVESADDADAVDVAAALSVDIAGTAAAGWTDDAEEPTELPASGHTDCGAR